VAGAYDRARRVVALARWRPLLGVLALFSGAALLLNIVVRLDLRIGLLASTVCLLIGVGWVYARSSSEQRRSVTREVIFGALAGIAATLAYDVSKVLLAAIDPSPFDPFHAIGVFGQMLTGSTEPGTFTVTAGILFHLVNGTSFGVAYVLLFGRRGDLGIRRAAVTGVGWGMFLELFQLTLYPGWLDIRAYSEFAAISLISHVVYGVVLGIVARSLFRARSLTGGSGRSVVDG
jgi:hypothetical protein